MVRNNPRNRNSETELFKRGPTPFIQNMHPRPAQDTDLFTHTPTSRITEGPLAPRESQKQRHDGYPFTHMHTHTRTSAAETHTQRKSRPSFPPLARSRCLWLPRSLYHACDVPDIMWQVGELLIQKKQKMRPPPQMSTHQTQYVQTAGAHLMSLGGGQGSGLVTATLAMPSTWACLRQHWAHPWGSQTWKGGLSSWGRGRGLGGISATGQASQAPLAGKGGRDAVFVLGGLGVRLRSESWGFGRWLVEYTESRPSVTSPFTLAPPAVRHRVSWQLSVLGGEKP